ncbi:HdeD family acid-resistance protein [Pusillimonas sp. ANT_WB101]|uniref:HdeD family acid-resistance protein n=1 Tax=Pusillimonas sp. ANT_WB101 TaxID=2597356 RepID=UPI0011EE2C9E|nr:HdeD family acid-resistance protein [Pusillimonas sp. ANT_WB101]KAA0911044.1 HdeD family acid-resistance protein [Pusillimonas sp. ANT_WB101]
MVDPSHSSRPEKLAAALSALSAQWGWFVALGLVMLILGIVASSYVLSATLVSVLFVGILMLIGGISQLLHAWRIKNWSNFLFWTVAGVLYAGAGLLAIINPMAGASLITLLLGATLIGTGALRLWIWYNNRGQQGWQWLAFSGFITLLAGVVIAIGWPGNSAWLLGLLLALDLMFQGWTLMFLGFALRRQRRQ